MGEKSYVEEELNKARQALEDAGRLSSGGGSDAGIVNRLYYGAFHAAQAALYDRGVDAGSHGGVRNRFGEEVVLAGDARADQGRLLTSLADLRQQADYGYEPLEVDIEPLLKRTQEFVEDMEELTGGDEGE